jgi:hypothetical protein
VQAVERLCCDDVIKQAGIGAAEIRWRVASTAVEGRTAKRLVARSNAKLMFTTAGYALAPALPTDMTGQKGFA